jgi:hypothetical protein
VGHFVVPNLHVEFQHLVIVVAAEKPRISILKLFSKKQRSLEIERSGLNKWTGGQTGKLCVSIITYGDLGVIAFSTTPSCESPPRHPKCFCSSAPFSYKLTDILLKMDDALSRPCHNNRVVDNLPAEDWMALLVPHRSPRASQSQNFKKTRPARQ